MNRVDRIAVALALTLAACGSPDGASKSRRSSGASNASGRVVEVDALPQVHRDLLRAYGAGGEEWAAARERALADPALTRFVVENVFLEFVRAHRSLGGMDSARARRARDRASSELGSIGAPAAPTLIAVLEVGDDVTAELAMEVLGEIGRPALGPLVDALKSESPRARQRVASTLARMPHGAREEPRIREALIAASSDGEWFVRAQIARALGARGSRDTETTPWRNALQSLLLDSDAAVVEAAATGLVDLRDGRAIGVLIDVLARATEGGEPRKFNAVHAALVRLSGAGELSSIAAWRDWWRDNRARFESRSKS